MLQLFKFLIIPFRKFRKILREFIALRQVSSHQNQIFIGGKTRLTKSTILGKNPNFNGLIINGYGKVVIGDNFHSGVDCLFITSNHNYEGTKIPYDHTHVIKDIIIEDNVWIGSKVIVLGGVTIGEGAIIQAGSVVQKSIPKFGIAGGNPAIVFKYRDIDHYLNLKNKRLFH